MTRYVQYDKSEHHLLGQNRIWVKFLHFWSNNDGERWFRKNVFKIPLCAHHGILLLNLYVWSKLLLSFHLIENGWRMEDFKNIFSRPLFTIIFRPEILKFHPYSILIRQTMVRFVKYPEVYRKIIFNPSTHQIDIEKGVKFP